MEEFADFGMGGVDDSEMEAHEAKQAAAKVEKEARVRRGADPDQFDHGDIDPEAVAAMSVEEREARWGFTVADLAAATKVVTVLFGNPGLYVGDPLLADSRLYTMVSRDRDAKRGNKGAFKKVQNAERSLRTLATREEDLKTIKKTAMKAEREAALNALLLAPPPEDEATLLIADAPCAASSGLASPTAADGAASPDLKMHRIQKCHTCKGKYHELHEFYYSLCPPCGALNFMKRNQSRPLPGKVVLLTGCRIKIGYAMALMLLRAGAVVVGTTRFIHDALNRFMLEKDYGDWHDRLHLYAVDLRDLWVVTQFSAFMNRTFPKLYAIINNAAQTIARTPEYTAQLRHGEMNPNAAVHEKLGKSASTVEWMSFFLKHSSVEVGQPLKLEHNPHVDGADGEALNPATIMETPGAAAAAAPAADGDVAVKYPAPRYDRYDTAAEANDLREQNTWTTNLGDVQGGEAAEVMAINALSPFILNAKLKPSLTNRDGEEPDEIEVVEPIPGAQPDDEIKTRTVIKEAPSARFIINVSAMEGQFYRHKQTTHPHTNMAKAALNMMTRTSASDYEKDCIFMNSVDTGWITDESPVTKKQRRADAEMLCPLDEIDAAARCLDLIFMDSRQAGLFWKDYHTIPW
jgi:NAD(P)-dependent dehydrogenase (short-subunit alcohol dehydrogenase family)